VAGEAAVILRERARSALSRSGLPDLDYALNPYVGCAHGCVYCYAREYVRDAKVAREWGRVVVVKENVADLLRREVSKLRRGVVGVSTITDPYQPVERELELTRKCLKVLLEAGFKVSVQTKSSLVERDLDLFEKHLHLVDVGFTITTLDEGAAKVLEPGAPPPRERARALERIASKGVETWVFLGPVVPGFNDSPESLEAVVELAASTGSALYVDKLRVKPFMLEGTPLQREIAKRAERYDWAKLFELAKSLCKKHGVELRHAFEPKPS